MEEEERLEARLRMMSDYQSYDFSFKDTDLEREVRKRQQRAEAANVQRWRWLLVLCIGATVAILSLIVNLGIAGLNSVKIKATERMIASTGGFWRPYFLYVGVSAAYAVCAGAIVAFWAPAAAGSGMSEIKAYFNGVHSTGLLSLRTLIGKLLSALFVLAAGLIAEGEAPFVHIGAIVGGGFASAGSRSLTKLLGGRCEVKLPRSWGGFFRNDFDHRNFSAIGAAAGMATAFAAPLSGMVFIAEESAANLGAPTYYKALAANCVAILVFNILSSAFSNGSTFWNTRLFLQLDTSTADVLGLFYVRLWELPIVVAMAFAIGALGSLFVAANSRLIYMLRRRFIPTSSRFRRTLEVVGLAVLTGTLWFGISYGSPCSPTPSPEQQDLLFPQPLPSNILTFARYNRYPRLWCPAGQYSVYGQVFMRPPRLMLRNLVGLSQGSAHGLGRSLVDAPTAALYGALTFAMLTLTYGAGASLGVITPVLQFGAACGLLVGHGIASLATRIDSTTAVSLSTYAIVGAAAFLSGCVRYKASAVLITVESTGAWFLVVPVTIAVFCAKVVADRFNPLPPVVAIPDLLHVLKSTSFQAFPVTEEVEQAAQPGAEFHVLGVIERKAVLKMLQHRIGFCDSAATCELPENLECDGGSGSGLPEETDELLSLLGSFEQRPFKADSPEDQAAILRDVGQSCVGRHLNLRPFMFRAPLLVQQGASLTRALSLFRQIGLHHILVAPPDPRAIGFITRKDLVFDNACLAHLRKHKAGQGMSAASNGVGHSLVLEQDPISTVTADVASCLEGAGRPVIISDAFSKWPALQKWSFAFFRHRFGQRPVKVNDRAPARHADLKTGVGLLRTCEISLDRYIQYIENLPSTLEELRNRVHSQGSASSSANSAPYYLNGWRAFSEHPELADDCPGPDFLRGVDQSAEIMCAVEATLLGKALQKPEASPHLTWSGITSNLKKVFMGPPGTVTRLHYDAGAAHGYLGQVIGRKLFVLYPPTDTPFLYRIEGETETVQSAIDPLDPCTSNKYPLYTLTSPVAFVLHPMEAVVIPQGWWHYAVALDASITVMQNFYHAPTNAAGMVRQVLKSIAGLKMATG
ncbi:hypothetical protein WJX75_006445 [Coccomyxa subellipsoidea]|uniref:JmjC domain-containing protein n=1 Tax=Coccomyxa subellipsoidea TaxID=248742 RepID=A0ABR2YUL0_9CHLO